MNDLKHLISYRRLLWCDYISTLVEVENIEGVEAVYPGGSRYTYSGEYKDTDVIVLAQDKSGIFSAGYDNPEGGHYKDCRSFRKGDVNLIVLSTPAEFLNRCAAAELCRVHDVDTKQARADVHEAIRS